MAETYARIYMEHRLGGVFTRIPDDVHAEIGQGCLLHLEYGSAYGVIAEISTFEEGKRPCGNRYPFERLANEKDADIAKENSRTAKEILTRLRRDIIPGKPFVKLLSAVFSHDRERLIISVGAPENVDLRRYTGKFQREYRTRISIRLVGIRDEAALIGCIGHCGRTACCCSWQKAFPAVNTRMARVQNLSGNPSALNGMCGRLRCCLSYEMDFYDAESCRYPEPGAPWKAPDGTPARVIACNLISGQVTIRTEQGHQLTVPLEERPSHEHPPRQRPESGASGNP